VFISQGLHHFNSTGRFACRQVLPHKGESREAIIIAEMVFRKEIAIKPARARGNFLPKIIAPWAPKRQLPFNLLSAGTSFGVPQKDTTAFA
jgi:hypothetical protein